MAFIQPLIQSRLYRVSVYRKQWQQIGILINVFIVVFQCEAHKAGRTYEHIAVQEFSDWLGFLVDVVSMLETRLTGGEWLDDGRKVWKKKTQFPINFIK